MPFSQTPTNDSYSQQNVSLTREWTSRQGDYTGAKDEGFINCFAEVVKNQKLGDNRVFIYKRGGSSVYSTPPLSGTVRGAYYWNDQRVLVYCIDKNVYIQPIPSGTLITLTNFFTTTTGTVGFEPFLFASGATRLALTDGTTLATISETGIINTVSSVNLPVPHLPIPVFLDGYLFVVKTNTGNIYNSNVDDPYTWTGDFITTEIESDIIRAISKVNNYIVALGSSSIEYFYDAANTTGSPLGRNATPIKHILYSSGLAKHGNDLYFVGTYYEGQVDVFKLSDFTVESVGSQTVTRYLNGQSAALSSAIGEVVFSLGHTFYILNLGNYTFTYDFDMKYWSRWSYQTNTSFSITNAVAIENPSGGTFTVFTIGSGNTFYKLDDTIYQDNGVNFQVTLTTEAADFGTLNRKTMSRISFTCDRPNQNSLAYISWSDDDFQSFNAPQPLNHNQDLPCVYRCGSFRQRAFKITYSDNYPFRIQNIQVNINKGRN